MRSLSTILVSLLMASAVSASETWPQFRGPASAAVAKLDLKGKLEVLWRTPIHDLGRGWSSPIVWKDRIYATAVKNDKTPKSRPGLYIADVFGKTIPGEHEWVLGCFSIDKGELLWTKTLHKGDAPSAIHTKNSYASETPVTDGERIYAYFGNVGLFCTDMNGKQLWDVKPGTFKTRYGWGTASSPALYKNRLFLVHDNEEKSFLAAYDPASGKELYRIPRDETSNWATPFIWENKERIELIASGRNKVRSYDLEGKLLWELEGM